MEMRDVKYKKKKNSMQKTQNKNIGQIKCLARQIFRWMAQYLLGWIILFKDRQNNKDNLPKIRFDTTRLSLFYCFMR